MSEEIAAESSVSTSDVATEVYESFESSDSTNETASALPIDTTSAVEAKADTPGVVQPAPKPLTEAEKLLHAEGFQQERRDDGRENRIPYSKVKKIIENGINQGKGEFGQEYQALETEVTSYRTKFQEVEPVLSVLDQGPEAFLAEAGKYDPRYKAFLEARQAPLAAQQAPMADLPGPDLTLPDGSRTYSIDGIQKSLIPYIVQLTEARAEAKAMAALKPITEREERAKQVEQQTQAETKLRERTHQTIEEAKTWPGFADHEESILTALREDSARAKAEGKRPSLSLEAAYRTVVIPHLMADDASRRERLAKEMSAATKAPTVARSGGETPRVGPQTTQSIAARTYARLEGGA